MDDISRHEQELRIRQRELRELLNVRQRELRELLNDWDPIGIVRASAPKDEYDCFFGVIGDLRSGISEQELGRYFESQLRDHFGLDPGPARPTDFAHRVFNWYWRNPLPGSVPPEH